MPKIFRMEYTVSIYAVMVPIIINIQAASLVPGHSIMAKKAAAAPRTSWLEIYIVCPASMLTVSALKEKNSSLQQADPLHLSLFSWYNYNRVIDEQSGNGKI
jgi:hypothetical protein